MATLDDNNYSPTWSGISNTLSISIGVSVLVLGAHEVLRRKESFRNLFMARCLQKGNRDIPKPSMKVLGWIKSVYQFDLNYLLKIIGLDGIMYLKFLKLCVVLTFFSSLFIAPLLLPLNYIGHSYSELEEVGTVQEFSINGIKSGSPKLWIHNFCLACFTIVSLYLLWTNSVEWMNLRNVCYVKMALNHKIETRSIMVRNLPTLLNTEEKFESYFVNLGLGEIEYTTLLRYPRKLVRLFDRRNLILKQLEFAHLELVNNFNKDLVNINHWSNYETQLELIKELIITKKNTKQNIWELLAEIDPILLNKYQPLKTNKDSEGYLIDSLYQKLIETDKEIEILREVNYIKLRHSPSETGFITFKSVGDAQLCASSILHSKIGSCINTLSPELRDIQWGNHAMPRTAKLLRKLIINISVWSLIILWLIPIVPILTLVSYDVLAKQYPVLVDIANKYSLVRTILQNFIPAILLAIFMSILPHLLYFLTSFQANSTYSDFERLVVRRYYAFSIFNVLIVFLIGPTFINIFFNAIQSRVNILELIALKLPEGAAFFINYICFNICYQVMELISLGSPLLMAIYSSLFPSSPRTRNILEKSWPFPAYYYIPIHMLMFVITITYAAINPIILPFSLSFFVVTYFVFKHQFCYVYINEYETNGKMWNLIVQYMTDGLLLALITLVSITIFKENFLACLPSILSILSVFWFKSFYNEFFCQRSKAIPLNAVKIADVHYSSRCKPIFSDDEEENSFTRIQSTTEFSRRFSKDLDEKIRDVVIDYIGDSKLENALKSNEFLHPCFHQPLQSTLLLPLFPNQRYYAINQVVEFNSVLTSSKFD